ncbi:unnamed protein product [Euphydryas editha]|uniref:Uncharacterized protein n=1 Tax=Euphydryas editha TaxID=104508 RepID=A0AAU9TI02_EUPED|nr:unnamed protein product [Euphydryas editha]
MKFALRILADYDVKDIPKAVRRLEVLASRRVGGPVVCFLELNYIMYGFRLEHATSRYVSALGLTVNVEYSKLAARGPY